MFVDKRATTFTLTLALVLGLANLRTFADTIYQYDPSLGTLPEAQGFTRIQDDINYPEPTVGGGILHAFPQLVESDQSWYENSASLDFSTRSYVLEADLHVISSNYVSLPQDAQRSGYYLWTVDSAGHSFAVGIDSNGITINTDGNFNIANGVPRTPFDTTDAFHTYRLAIDSGQGTLFIDGNQFASTPLGDTNVVDPVIQNRVIFGDASGAGVSESELGSIRFGTAVPEPGSLLLFGLGVSGLLVVGRRLGHRRRNGEKSN